ncbi:MAG: response regulator [Chloroflexi bacterium]|nr:response regulator [Chloroflexota bacterium]
MTTAREPIILIVDGDPAYRALLQALLRQHLRCRVHLAASEPELADCLGTHPRGLSLIILDWHLPGGTAPAALQLIRRDWLLKTVPVLILTAGAVGQERLRQQALAAGASACLSKAVDDQELLLRVRSLCQAGETAPQPLPDCPLRLLGRLAARADRPATVRLTRSQAELFDLLLRDPRAIVPRTELESRVLAYHAAADRAAALRKRIHRLNQRLSPLGVHIQARRNVGYHLVWH